MIHTMYVELLVGVCSLVCLHATQVWILDFDVAGVDYVSLVRDSFSTSQMPARLRAPLFTQPNSLLPVAQKND
jgi:hypothetical protein